MKLIDNNNELRYQRAKERIKKIKEFYTHAIIYSIFVIFFIYLNVNSGGFPWAIFPIGGWGLGVLGHANEAFEYSFFFGKKWEQRKIKEILRKEEEFIQF